MSYASLSDLKIRLGNRFDGLYENSEESALADLDAAQSEIDATLSARYSTPISERSAQAILKNWTLTLAEELTYSRAVGGAESDKLAKRVESVRANLREAAAGKLRIGLAEPAAEAPGGASIMQCDTPMFTRKKMEGF